MPSRVHRALETLLEHAGAADKEDASNRELAEAAVSRSREILLAMHATAALEAAQQQLADLDAKPNADAVVGSALLAKTGGGETIDEFLLTWGHHGTEGDGGSAESAAQPGVTDKSSFIAKALALITPEQPLNVSPSSSPSASASALASALASTSASASQVDEQMLGKLFEDLLVYLTLPYLTLPYLTLPYLTLPNLTLPYLTLPYLTLPYR